MIEDTVNIEAAVRQFVINRVQSLSNKDLSDFDTTKPLMSMGLDSHTAVGLVHKVNDKFDIKLDEKAVFNFPTTDALVAQVIRQRNGTEEWSDPLLFPVDPTETHESVALKSDATARAGARDLQTGKEDHRECACPLIH